MTTVECISGLVSVIIPAFNNAQYITECVESVENQTYQNIEIIIIDDGSTDNTENIVKDLQSKHHNITYKKISNSKSPAARNAGIAMAKGEFVASIDSDDAWPPYKIEEQVAELIKYPDAIVLGEVHQFTVNDSGERVWGNKITLPTTSGNYLDTILNLSVHKVVNFNTYLMRTSNMRSNGLWDPQFLTAHDWELWARLGKKYKFIHMNKVYQFYRKHDKSTTTARKNSYSFSLKYQLMMIELHLEKGIKGYFKKCIFKKRRYEEIINILLYRNELREAAKQFLSAIRDVHVFLFWLALPMLYKIIAKSARKKIGW
jgi:glycosyltransferase involved in cell wall biosynthesis